MFVGPYDKQYFIIYPNLDSDKIPSLNADANTSLWNYSEEVVTAGPPLKFINSYKKRMLKKGIKETVPDVLFDGFRILVRSHIREKILNLDVPGLVLQPSIYLDIEDNLHEDFWYLTFTQKLDCWDREHSIYDDKVVGAPVDPRYILDKFVLDADVLDKIPLEKRLMFRMGKVLQGFVFVHESIMGWFMNEGAELISVVEFGEGFADHGDE